MDRGAEYLTRKEFKADKRRRPQNQVRSSGQDPLTQFEPKVWRRCSQEWNVNRDGERRAYHTSEISEQGITEEDQLLHFNPFVLEAEDAGIDLGMGGCRLPQHGKEYWFETTADSREFDDRYGSDPNRPSSSFNHLNRGLNRGRPRIFRGNSLSIAALQDRLRMVDVRAPEPVESTSVEVKNLVRRAGLKNYGKVTASQKARLILDIVRGRPIGATAMKYGVTEKTARTWATSGRQFVE